MRHRPQQPATRIEFRNEAALHQRPAVRGPAGIQSGDPGAQQDLHEQDQRHDPGGGCEARRRLPMVRQAPQIEAGPDQARQQEQCGAQMGREAEMADIGPRLEPGGHHPPADKTLGTHEKNQHGDAPGVARRNGLAPPEPQKGDGEGEADQAPEIAVAPLPEIDLLERSQIHAGRPVDLGVFRDSLVKFEFRLPIRLGQRRKRADQRFPFGNGQAAFGQPGDAPHRHDAHDHHGDDQQPVRQELGTRFRGRERTMHSATGYGGGRGLTASTIDSIAIARTATLCPLPYVTPSHT